jgi:hypothetical protein
MTLKIIINANKNNGCVTASGNLVHIIGTAQPQLKLSLECLYNALDHHPTNTLPHPIP